MFADVLKSLYPSCISVVMDKKRDKFPTVMLMICGIHHGSYWKDCCRAECVPIALGVMLMSSQFA